MSVIIPVAGPPPVLGDQLAALDRQALPGLDGELIVVYNGGGPGGQDAAALAGIEAMLCALDGPLVPRIVRAERRRGINVARNDGARAAQGELLLFCDADDVAAPGWVVNLAAAARRYDIVGGRLDERLLNGGPSSRPPLPPDSLPVGLGFLPFALGANFAVWRHVLLRLGSFDERYPLGWDDADLCFRAQLHGYRIGRAPGAVVAYRHRGSAVQTFAQFRSYGRSEPLLYRRFRPYGMPRPSVGEAGRRWASLLRPRSRGRRAYRAGYLTGRIEGSLRWRVRYL